MHATGGVAWEQESAHLVQFINVLIDFSEGSLLEGSWEQERGRWLMQCSPQIMCVYLVLYWPLVSA